MNKHVKIFVDFRLMEIRSESDLTKWFPLK